MARTKKTMKKQAAAKPKPALTIPPDLMDLKAFREMHATAPWTERRLKAEHATYKAHAIFHATNGPEAATTAAFLDWEWKNWRLLQIATGGSDVELAEEYYAEHGKYYEHGFAWKSVKG